MPLATNCPITLTTHPWQFSITLRRVGADGGGSFQQSLAPQQPDPQK